ncbi:hypothetical protein K491DRAFT_119561 [Lophiostoma macrostomum CBS 122681]|uniref:Uncharacterized protein n=1 Tax=Lophiostoma macrostomum CBS 122681 TaxID=1314788 RepID=A0A6A6SVT6_9PLEO|nr:hypothetical protein K491DRAFT_119561 [Lophiostoma macrostomum CBS 122681]
MSQRFWKDNLKSPFKSRKNPNAGGLHPSNGYGADLAESPTGHGDAKRAAQRAMGNVSPSPPTLPPFVPGVELSSLNGTIVNHSATIPSYRYTNDDTARQTFLPLQGDPAQEGALVKRTTNAAAEEMLAQSLEENSESESDSTGSARMASIARDRATLTPGSSSNPEVTLKSIIGHILHAGQSFDKLQGIDMNDAEGAVIHVLQAYAELATKRRRKKRHRLQKSTENNDPEYWRKMYKKSDREVENLKTQKKALIEENKRLKREKVELKNNMQSLRERTDGEVANMHLQLKAKNEEIGSQTQSHILHIQELHRRWQQAVNSAKAETAGAVLRERLNLQAQHREEITRANNESSRKLETTRSELNKLLEERRVAHEEVVKNLRQDIAERDLRAQEERDYLEQKAAEEKVEIIKLNETLTGALVHREHIKGLADSVLVARFSSLAVKLEGISNIDWNDGLRETWPYTEEELRAMSRNTRKLKQQMVLNTLWFALNEYIFSTPFRILGTQGRSLDTEWFERYSGSKYCYYVYEWFLTTYLYQVFPPPKAHDGLFLPKNARHGAIQPQNPISRGYRPRASCPRRRHRGGNHTKDRFRES